MLQFRTLKIINSFNKDVHCITWSKSFSFLKDFTSDPIIESHVLSVKTFLINGSFSPWRITMLEIWITRSFSGSGKIPLRPAHSISKLRIRIGAIFCHSPKNMMKNKGCGLKNILWLRFHILWVGLTLWAILQFDWLSTSRIMAHILPVEKNKMAAKNYRRFLKRKQQVIRFL